ncbi:NADH dehydrogenase [ubiquinone] 1 alpha subcomplex assembly factor 3-like [Glandiceps talaboti]
MATSMLRSAAVRLSTKTSRLRHCVRHMSKMYPTDDELYQKTTISILSKEAGGLPFITGYSSQGFTISGDRVVGPVAILPKTLVHWNVSGFEDINEGSLSLFHVIEPKIELLILGLGTTTQRLDPELHKFMRSKGIALEVQDTAHACQTFNYLMNESRVVAAGLIPPLDRTF